jgi:hypothetical protein
MENRYLESVERNVILDLDAARPWPEQIDLSPVQTVCPDERDFGRSAQPKTGDCLGQQFLP